MISAYRRHLLMQAMLKGDYPPWFKKAIVCWYDPSKQGLTNEELAKDAAVDGRGYSILKDFSGNGLDMKLHGFAGEGISGIGGYETNFKDWTYASWTSEITNWYYNKFTIVSMDRAILYYKNKDVPSFMIKVSGLKNGELLNYTYVKNDGVALSIEIKENKIQTIPYSYGTKNNGQDCGFKSFKAVKNCSITIELLPLYPNALVFDGNDDYGISENQPKLTDYTVVTKRKWISYSDRGIIAGKQMYGRGEFIFEGVNPQKEVYCSSFGGKKPSLLLEDKDVTYQTKNEYNDQDIEVGIQEGTNKLTIAHETWHWAKYSNFALYSFLLFNRTLTQDELDYVKYVIMKEPLPEPIAVYNAKGRSNDEAADTINVLPNLAPNGNHDYDIQLNNFNFDVLGNYGGYGTNWNDWKIILGDGNAVINDSKTLTITDCYAKRRAFVALKSSINPSKLRIKVSNLNGNVLLFGITKEILYIKNDGIYDYTLEESNKDLFYIAGYDIFEKQNITIELLPQYPDGLYFDGVDDSGICEKFPIFTKEKGYTIIAKRKIFGHGHVVSKSYESYQGAFILEASRNHSITWSFGYDNSIVYNTSDITWQKSNSYNNQNINTKNANDSNKIWIGALRDGQGKCNMVLYELHIFDHDLTPKEIELYIQRNIDANYVLPTPEDTPQTTDVKQLN